MQCIKIILRKKNLHVINFFFSLKYFLAGQTRCWQKHKYWLHGNPRNQIWRLDVLPSASVLRTVANLSSYRCQMPPGWKSAQGTTLCFLISFSFTFGEDGGSSWTQNISLLFDHSRIWMDLNFLFFFLSGHFAQRGSHGRWTDVISLSERRISHCRTHPEHCLFVYSLYKVLDSRPFCSLRTEERQTCA